MQKIIRCTIRVLALLGVFVALPLVGRSTAPMPPPYSLFTVSGAVERTDGGTVENLPVVLTRLSAFYEDGYEILRGSGGGSRDVALTLADGSFMLSVKKVHEPNDTIAVAVVLPDDKIYFGNSLVVDTLAYGTATNWYTTESTGYCKTGDTVEYTEGYLFAISSQTVSFP